ncbi:MAG: trehalase-like domain-containing protein, partial [Terrimesophilobacter sp.]
MAMQIEDYALIGDCHTGAMVGRDGSIDWLCLPRFDSPSMFGALLGDKDHGRWLLAPERGVVSTSRRYVDNTFVLVTRWVTDTGEVEVTDLMPFGDRRADLVRRVVGISGSVDMMQDLRIRFGYAAALPWIRQTPENDLAAIVAVAGPDSVIVRGPRLTAADHSHVSHFTVLQGDTVDISMTWYPSHRKPPEAPDVSGTITRTVDRWQRWIASYSTSRFYDDEVRRSLLVLRALTHEDTGGIAAAATTSLPEQFGGTRNWDYR